MLVDDNNYLHQRREILPGVVLDTPRYPSRKPMESRRVWREICAFGIPDVLHFSHMSKTVTIRLTKELATWLEQASRQSGVPKGRIVREQLERARESGKEPSFMRLAGSVHGARDLSTRKGFSRS
jgi:hypothetical protein